MNNNNNQQTKPDSKGKAIASLVLGVISIATIIIIELMRPALMGPVISIAGVTLFYILPLIAIIALILGILGLKSTKRNYAIVGIILSLISLIVPLMYFLFH